MRAKRITSRCELTQHVMENAAIAVIFHLVSGIDPAQRREGEGRAIAAGDFDLYVLTRRKVGKAFDAERVVGGQIERLARRAVFELQRQDAHANEVRPVDPLKAFNDDGAHAQKDRTLGRPVARRAGAVL